MTGSDPLRIFIHEEGLARFATEPYKAPTAHNLATHCMHLTNYAVNKRNEKFEQPTSELDASKGHKRSLASILELLDDQGHDIDTI